MNNEHTPFDSYKGDKTMKPQYVWLGILFDTNGAKLHKGRGTAHRPRNSDGSKNKAAPYESFREIQKATYRAHVRAPIKPRLSRKGNSLSGALPRLCGY